MLMTLIMPKDTIRILLADDHEIVRKSIMAILELEPDMTLVGVAEDGRKAVELAEKTVPDVIIMDISMPDLDGIRAAGEITSRGLNSRIIMLSMHHNSTLVQQARKNGASGYVMKQKVGLELIPAIRAANEGRLTL